MNKRSILTITVLIIVFVMGWGFSWVVQPISVMAEASQEPAITCTVEELRPIKYVLFSATTGYTVGEPQEGDTDAKIATYVDEITPYWVWFGDVVPEDPTTYPDLRYAIIRGGEVIADVNSDYVTAIFYLLGE